VSAVTDDEECDSTTCVSHRAAYSGDLEQLETLLKAGILSLDHRDQLGSSLLHKGILRSAFIYFIYSNRQSTSTIRT